MFERRLGGKKRIVDDQENMTLFQLVSCWLGHSSGIATGDLSTDYYGKKESDDSDKANDNTNSNIEVDGKAEEHPNGVENDSNSELMEN